MTPTTAAVTPASAPFSRGASCSFSTNGAPRKIQAKQGAKVTHSVSRLRADAADSTPPGA